MNKRIIFIGIAITTLITVLVIKLYDFSQYSSDENVVFIENNRIESIHDLTEIEKLSNKTVLVNLWTPDSDNCLYSTEKGGNDLTNLELLHVFSSNDFNNKIEFTRFVKKKQVNGNYLLLSTKNYNNFVKEISLSRKGTTGGFPIQFFVENGTIIEINENNKEYLSAFRKK